MLEACACINAITLKSSFRTNSGVGFVGCEQKISVVRERKFEVVDKQKKLLETGELYLGRLAPELYALRT